MNKTGVGIGVAGAGAAALAIVLAVPALTPPKPPAPPAPPPVVQAWQSPRPDHIVVVNFENKDRKSIIGSSKAPYLNALAKQGANMSRSYGVTHPSQPNYIAQFSGSQHGIKSNTCTTLKNKPNLGRQLLDKKLTFVSYSEGLSRAGFTGCSSGRYKKKHNAAPTFQLPASSNLPFSAFPRDFTKLPTVAFVSPDMCNSMHDCSVSRGDAWAKKHLDNYAQWAKKNNSLLIVTTDENGGGTVNQIMTILVGEMVRPGLYSEKFDHYGLLRTIQDAYGLPGIANSAKAKGLKTIWTNTPQPPKPKALINPSFETALTGWTAAGYTANGKTGRHGGTFNAQTGSFLEASFGDSTLAQTFTVPAGKKELSLFWLGRCSGG